MTDLVPTTEWTPERVGLVKATVAQDTTDDELAMFLSVAQSRGLDPFAGEIHAIVRGRDDNRKMTIQTGIGGYRTIADRTGLVDWTEGPLFTDDLQTWVETWVADEPPAAAKFTVKRKDRTRPESRTVAWREYVQTTRRGDVTSMWRDKPATMLGKCAEAAALRAAFPQALNGLYTNEEMAQADVDVVGMVRTGAAVAAVEALDDQLGEFPDEFLASQNLDALRAHAAKSDEHLEQALRILRKRHADWTAADGETVQDAEVVSDETLPDPMDLRDRIVALGRGAVTEFGAWIHDRTGTQTRLDELEPDELVAAQVQIEAMEAAAAEATTGEQGDDGW